MGKDQLTHPTPNPELGIRLMAEPEAALSSGSLRLYAMLQNSTTPVGALDLYAYDPLNRRCAVGIMVANNYRRQGIALAMLHQAADIARTTYHLHQLYADVAAPNTASLALFQKAGYTPCGHFAQWLATDDTYTDTIRLQHLLP
ncbi:MAG: GNAT family N-acetyltransferase [Bacteroidales bacterium]|nr:GNAT family N-acetyltransferase [Bacteroidales bacterium]